MPKKLQSFFICFFLVLIVIFIFHHQNSSNIEMRDTLISEPTEQIYVQNIDEYEQKEDWEEYLLQPPELLARVARLREQYDNSDIVGFLEITGTNISYPVVQTYNNEFYLYHDLHGNSSSAGSVFLDYENDLYTLTDDNTIIYGHNMRGGSKFHNIRYFHNEDFFRAHTYILLDTPYKETVWDIFSFFHTTIDFCYLTTNFRSRDDFYAFLLELQGRSHFTTDIILSEEDQILILSTCGVMGGANRYVIVAKLRR